MLIKDLLKMYNEKVLISAPVVGGIYRISISENKLDLSRTHFESFTGRRIYGLERDFLNKEIEIFELLR